MTEYIDREALKSAIYADGNLTAYLDYIINRVPSIDVRPAIHATWETDTCHFYCSECEHYVDYKTNFCPNCGADMREES